MQMAKDIDAIPKRQKVIIMKVVEGASRFLSTTYSKDLILSINALLAGERDYQRTYLETGMVPLLLRELYRSWVYSWIGATIPDVDDNGDDAYFCILGA